MKRSTTLCVHFSSSSFVSTSTPKQIKAPVAKGLTLAGNDIIKNSIRLNEHFEDPLETNPQLPMETRQPWTKTKPQPHERK